MASLRMNTPTAADETTESANDKPGRRCGILALPSALPAASQRRLARLLAVGGGLDRYARDHTPPSPGRVCTTL